LERTRLACAGWRVHLSGKVLSDWATHASRVRSQVVCALFGLFLRLLGLIPERIHFGQRGFVAGAALLSQFCFDEAKATAELAIGALQRQFRLDAKLARNVGCDK